MLSKILKNTTGSDIELEVTGITVPASGQEEIRVEEYLEFAKDESVTEIDPYLSSGDLVLNDGTNDLDYDTAIRFLEYSDRLVIEKDDAVVDRYREALNFEGGVTVTSETGKTTVKVGGETGVLCALWQSTFGSGSSSSDYWMDNEYDNSISNKVFHIAPWKSQLVAVTFSNEDDGVDVTVKLYSAAEVDTNQPRTKIFEWILSNCRVARKTTFTSPVIVEAGDKLGVFLSDQGKNPKYPVVVFHWKIIEENEEEVCRDFSGNFSLTQGTTTS